MTTTIQNDPVLSQSHAAVMQAYDVAVFLKNLADRAQEMNRLADIGTDIVYESGLVIHAMPFAAGTYDERTPLMHEIRLDGIDL
jgi:hypothetical protein